ncbi:hypothetical protein EV189_3923 [Motilibacter rhizosphaerae]|uniref:Uncharacterized protein n=1 Tax=Motilibacter rhizosphaerae TaxID=598652 RepID=A0A4Q7NA98_9ACTN|nr:hypothetical protein [Motilibacter rhizosphaerae]RZS79053.1 hypothetical protein EV189_3923 [Motilibacter rhizosphaerae]
MTGWIVAIIVVVVLLAVAAALVPRMRAQQAERARETELRARREEVSQQHHAEADRRARDAEIAEREARLAAAEAERSRAEAERSRAEADLHRTRADLTEQGRADELLDQPLASPGAAGTGTPDIDLRDDARSADDQVVDVRSSEERVAADGGGATSTELRDRQEP